MEHIAKRFGNVHALADASMEVNANEIVAVVGDNGSGKSTLIKILAGTLKPDSGSIIIRDREYRSLTPAQALKCGIAAVYQDLALDNYRDSAGNIFLGRELTGGGMLRSQAMRRQAERLLQDLNIRIPDISMPVGYLSGGQRQGVAVARALLAEQQLIIFDEPTAAMGVRESASVLTLIRELPQRGLSAIVVSHNLFQVFNIAQRIYVLRHGRVIGNVATVDSSPEAVHRMITEASEDD
ncbi:MAG: ATP-binding cassette domain-containing protein [Syntrophomonadaceae bacterium]|nr:ATP-binding cassette domain-containing protein [Syntrophomonadaceae bacterium]